MNIVNKLKWISDHSKPNNEILVRTCTSQGYEWFIHYTYEFEDEIKHCGHAKATVYRAYTNDLDSSLDDVIEIIESGVKEKYDGNTIFYHRI